MWSSASMASSSSGGSRRTSRTLRAGRKEGLSRLLDGQSVDPEPKPEFEFGRLDTTLLCGYTGLQVPKDRLHFPGRNRRCRQLCGREELFASAANLHDLTSLDWLRLAGKPLSRCCAPPLSFAVRPGKRCGIAGTDVGALSRFASWTNKSQASATASATASSQSWK